MTYYLNLTQSNLGQGGWEKEYSLRESFQVADASPGSMHRVLQRMATDRSYLNKYYAYNSVLYDLRECDEACRVDHVCAARGVAFDAYQHCLDREGAAIVHGPLTPMLISVAISVVWWSW